MGQDGVGEMIGLWMELDDVGGCAWVFGGGLMLVMCCGMEEVGSKKYILYGDIARSNSTFELLGELCSVYFPPRF